MSTQQEITDEMSQYYSQQFRSASIDYSYGHDAKVENEYNELSNKLLLIKVQSEAITVTEITRLIRTMQAKRLAGVDLTSNLPTLAVYVDDQKAYDRV